MELLDKKVIHKQFGTGTIIKVEGQYFDVQFDDNAVKTFVYPDSFETVCPDSFETIMTFEESEDRAELLNEAREREGSSPIIISMLRSENNIDPAYHPEFLSWDNLMTKDDLLEKHKMYWKGLKINVNNSEIIVTSYIYSENGNATCTDKWEKNGDYLCSGQELVLNGEIIDQKMAGDNLYLKEAEKYGKKVQLYVCFDSSEDYLYQGTFKVVGCTYENAINSDGKMTNQYIFRLRKSEKCPD